MSPARILVQDFVKIGLNQFFGAKHPYARLRAVQQRLTGVAMGRCKIGRGVSPDQDRLGIGA